MSQKIVELDTVARKGVSETNPLLSPNRILADQDIGLLILRFSVAGLMLFHGVHKLIHGMAWHQNLIQENGLPGILTYGIPIGEVVAPLLIIAGLFSRASAAVVAFTMVMSIYLAYGWAGFELNQYGGVTVELNLLFLFGAFALIFTGPGKYSLAGSARPWLR